MSIQQTDTEVTLSIGDKASLTVLLYGATVTSWKKSSQEQLFLSQGAILNGTKAVRGGIPLVFPVFGKPTDHEATSKLPQHGFARTSTWQFLGKTNEVPGEKISVQFGLGPEDISDEAKSQWGFDFTLVYTVTLTLDSLTTSLNVENTDSRPWDFNVLFHTYFKIPEIDDVAVTGLTAVRVADKVLKSSYVEQTEKVTFNGEVDRVYASATQPVSIESKGTPVFHIERSAELKDVVVWNPWTEKAEGMADFQPKSAFHQMVCVECGSVAEWNKLNPGSQWTGFQTIKSLL